MPYKYNCPVCGEEFRIICIAPWCWINCNCGTRLKWENFNLTVDKEAPHA